MALDSVTREALHDLAEGKGRGLRAVMEKVVRWAEVQSKTAAALGKQAEEASPKAGTGAERVALKLREAAEALQEATEAANEVLKQK